MNRQLDRDKLLKTRFDLNKMTSEDAYNLLDEIPSDGSDVSDLDDDLDEAIDMNIAPDVFDQEEAPDVFDHEEAPDVFDQEGHHNDNGFESEDDELPLITFVGRKAKKWTNNPANVTSPLPFEENVGPNIPDCLETPLDFFLHLFTENLLDTIVFQTNLYSVQKHDRNLTPTTVEEIKCFLGINLLMGVKKLPSYRDFWSSRFELRDHFISSCMSRDRFGWLLSHLHLNDSLLQPKRGDDNYDKLYKVRPMLNELSASYKSSYLPSRQQSIDESMIRFKGRSSLRQYMPMKPIKRGYKVWVRVDNSGYVLQFQIYTGKIKDIREQNLGSRVIKDLTRDLIGKCYEIYFDNYFNSVELQRDLLKEKIYACGTARKDRLGIPDDFKTNKKMKRGDSNWRVNEDGILALQWMDKKPILFLSNFHNPIDEETVTRKQKDGTKADVKCQTLVKDYNRHMGYVDKSDMLKSCYELDRKSKKWWHRIFFHFVDLTLVNSFILFKHQAEGPTISLKEFKIAVATGLIGADPKMPQVGRRSIDKPSGSSKFKIQVPLEIRTDKAAHMPQHGTKVRCTHCSTKAEPHRTRWHCVSCKVGLCLSDKKNCFIPFHEK